MSDSYSKNRILAAGVEKSIWPKSSTQFEMIKPYKGDPFVGHLDTIVTNSSFTRSYLSSLPAYNPNFSPLLRGISIGFFHGYFLVGPFTTLGPLRNSNVADYVGFLSTLSLLVILTFALLIYGYVTFSSSTKENEPNILTQKGWQKLTSGFVIGGFGGASIAYVLIKFFAIHLIS
jgi:photosystem I subunit 11